MVSIVRCKYLITFLDDYSRKVLVYFTRAKSDAFGVFKNFKAMIENQTDHKIKILRNDNGGEYESTDFRNFLNKNYIKHRLRTHHNKTDAQKE